MTTTLPGRRFAIYAVAAALVLGVGIVIWSTITPDPGPAHSVTVRTVSNIPAFVNTDEGTHELTNYNGTDTWDFYTHGKRVSVTVTTTSRESAPYCEIWQNYAGGAKMRLSSNVGNAPKPTTYSMTTGYGPASQYAGYTVESTSCTASLSDG